MYDYSDINLERLIEDCFPLLAPPENIPFSQWAEKNRVLDSMSSKFSGAWTNKITPWVIEPMDLMGPNSGYNHVVLMFGSQTSKTECIINTLLAYMDISPGPMMWFLPTDSQAQEYSKTRLMPAINNCERLSKMLGGGARDSNNTIMSKIIPGGSLRLSGANSPTNMAGYPVKVLCRDEIDRWPDDVKGEGSGLSLTAQRTVTFQGEEMIIDTSTPTTKGCSAIEDMFLLTDQRHWTVPCPHCGEYQELLFRRKLNEDSDELTRMMHFTRNEAGAVIKAELICYHCGCAILEEHKMEMQQNGKYEVRNPGASKAGFFVNGLNSLFTSWISIGERFFEAKGDMLKLKSFINTVLAETWEDTASYIKPDSIEARAEDYDKVPKEVIYLTCAVDVQRDRLEMEIRGWGKDFESWGIEYHTIYGAYDEPTTWTQLHDYLNYPLERDDGIRQKIFCTFIDSADGTSTKSVYQFCREHKKNRVFAIHGRGGENMQPIHAIKDCNQNKIRIITLGSDTLKDLCNFNLKIKEHGKNYVHFPKGCGYDSNYYKMLTAEEKVDEINKKTNRIKRVWRIKKDQKRNESWDIFCYNRAAIEHCMPKNAKWERVEGKIIGAVEEKKTMKKPSKRRPKVIRNPLLDV